MVPVSVEIMRVEDFDFPRLPQGFKERFSLEIPQPRSERLASFSLFSTTAHDTIDVAKAETVLREELGNAQDVLRMPICVVKGRDEGPTLVAFAGVKGDEYEGMRAIVEVYEQLNPEEMRGNFIGVPVVNVPAFWSATRISPLDLKNLARTYPGRPDGTTSERIAYYSQNKIMAHADLFIDLHSGGRNTFLPLLCGYYNDGGELGRISREAAISFGVPVVWEHDVLSPGRTIYESVRKGIPTLYTECRGGGHLDNDDLKTYVNGLLNLLKYMNVLQGSPAPPPKQMFLGGAGDVDFAIAASHAGLFSARAELLERVVSGQTIGEVTDLLGNVLEKIRANSDGIVELVRSTNRVFPGEILFLISPEMEG
jgi:uncharacterized protein